MNKHKYNISHTKNYSILFSTVSKPWPSGLERRPRKYGWYSSGRTKQLIIPSLNFHSFIGRRSGALAHGLPTYKRRKNRDLQAAAFTIIEVVLVLAIAGLIFLMVFIALPALQRNQRDTQKKNDMNRLLAAITNYRSNNRGRLPAIADGSLTGWVVVSGTDFGRNYLEQDGLFLNPNGERYHTMTITSDTLLRDSNEMGERYHLREVYITSGARCDNGGAVRAAEGPNIIAVRTFMEGGGTYCIDG